MYRVTAYPEMKALIVFPAQGSRAGEIRESDQHDADQRQEDGNKGVHSLFSQTVMMGVADGALGGGVLRATDGDASAFQNEGQVAPVRLDRDHALVGGAGHAARSEEACASKASTAGK